MPLTLALNVASEQRVATVTAQEHNSNSNPTSISDPTSASIPSGNVAPRLAIPDTTIQPPPALPGMPAKMIRKPMVVFAGLSIAGAERGSTSTSTSTSTGVEAVSKSLRPLALLTVPLLCQYLTTESVPPPGCSAASNADHAPWGCSGHTDTKGRPLYAVEIGTRIRPGKVLHSSRDRTNADRFRMHPLCCPGHGQIHGK